MKYTINGITHNAEELRQVRQENGTFDVYKGQEFIDNIVHALVGVNQE